MELNKKWIHELERSQPLKVHNIEYEVMKLRMTLLENPGLKQVEGKSREKLTKCSLRVSFEQETQRFLRALRKANMKWTTRIMK